MDYLGWLLVGLLLGGAAAFVMKFAKQMPDQRTAIAGLLRSHFHPLSTDQITISKREFPFRVRADLQLAIDRLFGKETEILHFCGVRKEYASEGLSLLDCLVESDGDPAISVPLEYEDIDVGDELPVRVLKLGLWLLQQDELRFAVLLTPSGQYGQVTGIQFQVGTPNTPAGTRIANSSSSTWKMRF